MGKCIHCNKSATYNLKGESPRYCRTHKTTEMIDTRQKCCTYDQCTKGAYYGTKDNIPTRCFLHRMKGMINLKFKSCERKNCIVRATFDYSGGKGSRCSVHKLKGMIDVKHKRCTHSSVCLSINPVFDFPGGKGSFCATHRLTGMINVRDKTCKFPGCLIVNPNFNYKGQKGEWCVSHKLKDMIDVRSSRCNHNGCSKVNPCYDYPNGKGQFCSEHKLNGMIDVKNKLCQIDGCMLAASYGLKKNKPLCCASHRTSDMVFGTHRTCIQCQTIACYGKPGVEESHCALHREKGMIQRSNGKCKESLCIERALYGKHYIALHCEEHKKDDEINLIEKPCVSCQLITVLDSNNRCESCDPSTFQRVQLLKQNALFSFLDNIKEHPVADSSDRIVDSGICGRERPDRVYDFGDKIIILECDEEQHRSRPCLCEQTRMVNIGQSFGGIPVYFIRWNPDEYMDGYGTNKNESIRGRYKLVGELIYNIKHQHTILPNALVSALYLYYDGWKGIIEENWKILTEFTYCDS